MATLLDTSLLGYLLPVFTFLFIMMVVFAVMDKFKLVGDNKGIHWAVAFCISFIFLFSSDAVKFVTLLTPWFILLVVFGMFLVSFFIFIGVKEDSIAFAVKDPKVVWGVIGISMLVFFIALGNVFGDVFSGQATPGEGGPGAIQGGTPVSEGLKAIVHPRVLGALFLLIIAALSIRLISEPNN